MKDHNIISYINYLNKYKKSPTLDDQTFYYDLDGNIILCPIDENDLEYDNETIRSTHFRNIFIMDDNNTKTITVGFVEWLSINLINYIDKKIDYNELYDIYVESLS